MVLRDPDDLTPLFELPDFDFDLDLVALLLLRLTRLAPVTAFPLLPRLTRLDPVTDDLDLLLERLVRVILLSLFLVLLESLVLPIMVVLLVLDFLLVDLILVRRTDFSSLLLTDVLLVLSLLSIVRTRGPLSTVAEVFGFLRIRLTLDVFIPLLAKVVILGKGLLSSLSMPRRRPKGLRFCGFEYA